MDDQLERVELDDWIEGTERRGRVRFRHAGKEGEERGGVAGRGLKERKGGGDVAKKSVQILIVSFFRLDSNNQHRLRLKDGKIC